jgi:hypothetical protein
LPRWFELFVFVVAGVVADGDIVLADGVVTEDVFAVSGILPEAIT